MRKFFSLFFVFALVFGFASCSGSNGNSKSSEKDILTFSIGDRVGVISGTDIAVAMPFGTIDLNLTPTITTSEKASVNPLSDVEQDFSSDVEYTVTAEDGTTKGVYSRSNCCCS